MPTTSAENILVNPVYAIDKPKIVNGVGKSEVSLYLEPGSIEHQLELLWEQYQDAVIYGCESATNRDCSELLRIERQRIGTIMWNIFLPQLKRAVVRQGIGKHLHDDGVGEGAFAFSYALSNFQNSSRYNRDSFHTYLFSVVRTALSRFRKREMAEEKHRFISKYAAGDSSLDPLGGAGFRSDGDIIGYHGKAVESEANIEEEVGTSMLILETLASVMNHESLDQRSKDIFYHHFVDDMNINQIGRHMGTHDEHGNPVKPLNPQIVTRCLARAIDRAKKHILNDEPTFLH